MKLKIITHERTIFDNDNVDEIVIQTESGQMGILKNHIPVTTTLDIGVTKVKIGDKYKYFATLGGVFQFKDEAATILADTCEDSCDIDVARANEAKARGYKKFLKVLPRYVERTIGNYKDKVFVVSQSLREPQAKQLVEICKTEFPTATIEMVVMGQSTGANVGPGLCAAFYFGDERISKDCVKEKVVLEALLSEK